MGRGKGKGTNRPNDEDGRYKGRFGQTDGETMLAWTSDGWPCVSCGWCGSSMMCVVSWVGHGGGHGQEDRGVGGSEWVRMGEKGCHEEKQLKGDSLTMIERMAPQSQDVAGGEGPCRQPVSCWLGKGFPNSRFPNPTHHCES